MLQEKADKGQLTYIKQKLQRANIHTLDTPKGSSLQQNAREATDYSIAYIT